MFLRVKLLNLSILVLFLCMVSCTSSPPKRFKDVEERKGKSEKELLIEEYEAPFDVTRQYRPSDWEYDFYEF
ncbi:MAG: hypothetical protein CME64_01045 [Halobacteriovoraceae bacterium]|nr:hypothetical protein [Halobacteriovoraceae bacterium]